MAQTKETTQKGALLYICKKGNGYTSELKNDLDPKFINEFESVGFIKKGLDSKSEETWNATKAANSFFQSIYGEPTLIEKIKGYFCHYIIRI